MLARRTPQQRAVLAVEVARSLTQRELLGEMIVVLAVGFEFAFEHRLYFVIPRLV